MRRSRIAARCAWPLCGVTLALVACALVLAVLNHIDAGYLLYLAFVVSCAVVGSVVAAHQPTNPVGWCLVGSALSFALMECTGEYAIYGPVTAPGSLPGARAMAWPQTWLSVPGAVLVFAFLPLYFPDGRLVSPGWQWIVRAFTALSAVWAGVIAVLPGEIHEAGGGRAGVVNPLGIGTLHPLIGARHLPSPFLLMIGVAAASLVVRYRRSSAEERLQVKWLTYASATLPAIYSIEKLYPAADPLTALSLAGIPVAVGIAVLRYRLYHIDLIINRTLVFGGLTGMVVGLYVVVVGGLGSLLQARGNPLLALIATALVAVLFAPLRDRLQRSVNRVLYDEPYAALARFGRRLEETLVPETVAPTIVQTVRDTLKLPYVAVEGGEGVAACVGAPADHLLRVPLVYQGSTVGLMTLAPRAGSVGFSAADRRLLEDLARQAGIAIHAARMTTDLQRSRERLVAAREEERRRLRRDLHDGLGSRLAALNLQAGALRGLIPRDPATDEAIGELRAEIRAAIADIRRVVYDLRPTALDEVGLVGAIRQRAARCSVGMSMAAHHGSPESGSYAVQVVVEAPEDLPALPAAVEVAAYRIVEEALTNMVRHAGARHGVVRLAIAEGLCLEVADDGVGLTSIGDEGLGGMGLFSMRERAAELGGTCVIGPNPGGGTRVLAHLPAAKGSSTWS